MEKHFGVKPSHIWKKVIGGGGVNPNTHSLCSMRTNSKRKLKTPVSERGGHGPTLGSVWDRLSVKLKTNLIVTILYGVYINKRNLLTNVDLYSSSCISWYCFFYGRSFPELSITYEQHQRQNCSLMQHWLRNV